MDRRSQRASFFAYADNYLIDLKAVIIVDVEATRAIRQAEARTMIERTEDRLGLCPGARGCRQCLRFSRNARVAR